MSERKLATIQEILDVQPIEGADSIEKIKVKGWWCVSGKGNFKTGDKAVYFEVDSLLPINDHFKFLEPRGRKKMIFDGKDIEGYRLKTIKLRGQISQGLCLPLKDFFEEDLPLGEDVTEKLQVVKYEEPVPAYLSGKVKGRFPGFLQKTEEERIQNLPEYFETMQGRLFYITEKVDGSSGTYYIKNGKFGVCSRNLELLEEETNTFWKMARYFHLEEVLTKTGKNLAIQGEVVGPGIQKNRLKLSNVTLMVFTIFDIDTYQRYNFKEFIEFCETNKLQTVPIVNKSWAFQGSMDDIIAMADGESLVNKNTKREGLVFRALDETQISFKSLSNKYLLKHEE
ncbi:MAG: RNA ligase (ATP) [Leptospiraceae bacterium]|nr:RNA ligase (ATP) [Leptospiraceae bacterium]MCP5494098.1 RNA ligase (ATP) [Leptospiraceae bacterium]